jgi:hypothetical protein
MSNLSKSFVRGFGATLGVFAAKGLLDIAKEPGYRIGGVSTRRQWYAIGAWAGITAILGFSFGVVPTVFFFFLGLIPTFLFQVWAQSRENKKLYIEERNGLISRLEEISSLAKSEGIAFELDWSGEVQNYHLERVLNTITEKFNTIMRLRKKYHGELLDKMIDGQIWLGMTKENLIDIKGQPSQIEKSENSKTLTEVFVYGTSKRSGDVFTFKNGSLSEFKDR